MSKLHIIQNPQEIDTLIKYCKKTRYASIDFETSSTEYQDPEAFPLMLGVSFQPGSTWLIPLGHEEGPKKMVNTWEENLIKFGKEVMEDWDIIKIAHNFKFEYNWFAKYGIYCRGRLFDTMLAKYCLDEERPHDLKSIVEAMFPEFANYEDALKPYAKLPWAKKPFAVLAKYCGIDTDMEHRLMIYFEGRLISSGFYNLFRNLLMMISRVLAESEFRGIVVDRPYLDALIREYANKIEIATKEVMDLPVVRKFENRTRKEHIDTLIKGLTDEIQVLENSDAPRAQSSIAFRQKKIANILEGNFTNKEKYEGFNLGSPNQLIQFLFLSKHGLKKKVIKYTKNKDTKQKSDRPSTDEEVINALTTKYPKEPFFKKLLALRKIKHLDSTYVSGMLAHLDGYNRAHAKFQVHGTVTGRLSCVQPNLQNIPRGTTAADIKKMFIPPPGMVLIEVDYSQAELRVIAEVANDEAMIDIFRKNFNIHVATACKMNGGLDQYEKVKGILKKAEALGGKELEKPENANLLFWMKEKKKGKSLNFSIVYQQGDDATAETLKCSIEDARRFKADWFKEFPGVAKWIKKQKAEAKRNEYVMNMFGRKRRLYDINADSGFFRAEAERQAVNAPIQGASGDFALFSQVVIREKIKKGELPKELLQVYTVHDSIGFYCPPHLVHKVIKPIVNICDNPETQKYFGFELKKVKMKVSPEVGRNWLELHDYDPWTDYSKLVNKETINL